MSLYLSLIQAMIVILGLVFVGLILKRRGVISPDDRVIFGRLTTDLALPALIFVTLARQNIQEGELAAVWIMAVSLLSCMALAWIVGRALGLLAGQLGAFILVASFGSSSTLGYALISQTFTDPAALGEAVIISELGVGIPIFTVGVAVAIYFGQGRGGSIQSSFKAFLKSPIFISLILGLAVALLHLNWGEFPLTILTRILDLLGGTLAIFVSLAVALMLRPIPFRSLAPLILAAAAIKLLAKPLLAFALARAELLDPLDMEILLIETAMPSGTVAAVLADRYGCDGGLASALLIATFAVSLITIPLIMLL
ncbi:MAG: AEC family transporter [Methanotrichaceae archaeon]|nr:AEC family transporter [Methanotrichaceae archaeon]